MKYYLCYLLFFLLPFTCFAQNKSASESQFLACIENYYGTSNLLVNGRLYQARNTQAEGTPYFNEDWRIGRIYINGVVYQNQTIKYDLEQKVLIINKTLKDETNVQVTLDENTVDSFSIGQHHFVSKQLFFTSDTERGFLEKIYSGDFIFFADQGKYFDGISSNKYPNGSYLYNTPRLLSETPDGIQVFNNKNDFLNYFSDQKSAIKKFMKQNKIKYKKASIAQFLQILKFIDDAS